MADRIDIGLGPRLGIAPTDTSGFQFTGQTPISRQEYLSRPVDFTSEFLDTATLGQQTGIDVGAPEVGEEIAPVTVRDEQDQNDDDIPDILQGTLIQGTGESREIVAGLDAITGGTQYATYSEYLRDKGMADRVDIGKVESLYEPIATGKFGEIDLKGFGKQVETDVKAIPSDVQSGFEKLSTPEGREEIGEKAAQGLIGLAGGPLGAIAGSFIGGQTVTNAFGQASLRPSGLLGAVADMVHSKQYDDMNQIRAATAAGSADAGFAIRFGNFGVTRAPGARSYTGNMQGMSLEQVKELEALSKGYLPNTYQFDTSKKENIFGGKANVTVEASGGAYSDPDNKLKGFYTADGKYYTPGVGYSRYGNAADRNRLAATNGFSENEMQDIIEDARAGKGNLADLIQQEKDSRAAAAAAAAEAAAAAAKAEQERLAEIERNRQEQARIENAYTGYDDSGDDDGGWSAGGVGSGGSGGFGVGSFGTSGGGDRGFTGGFADGGTVGMAAGGAMAANMNSGFIGAPPSQVPEQKTVADDQLTEYPEGTFIINAAAVEFAGEKDIVKMLNDAQKEAVRRGITVDNTEKGAKLIDVAVSQGEVKVAPYLAKIIGYDRLNKINNRGKPEVAERQQEAAQGGFLGERQGYASGDKVTVYRGEPIDPDKARLSVDYEYGKENVGKFHTPSVAKARNFAHSAGPGNQQILSRKVTIDELFTGVEEAWKTHAKQETDYFKKMPKSELDKNIRFIRNMKKAYDKGERSLESMVMFLQEQVFHDDKSKVNFIETFKNDPKSAGKLAGRAISKVATKATPPLAILEMIGTVFTPTTMGDGTLQGNESFLEMNLSATR